VAVAVAMAVAVAVAVAVGKTASEVFTFRTHTLPKPLSKPLYFNLLAFAIAPNCFVFREFREH